VYFDLKACYLSNDLNLHWQSKLSRWYKYDIEAIQVAIGNTKKKLQ
jgi:hypothetical protein